MSWTAVNTVWAHDRNAWTFGRRHVSSSSSRPETRAWANPIAFSAIHHLDEPGATRSGGAPGGSPLCHAAGQERGKFGEWVSLGLIQGARQDVVEAVLLQLVHELV